MIEEAIFKTKEMICIILQFVLEIQNDLRIEMLCYYLKQEFRQDNSPTSGNNKKKKKTKKKEKNQSDETKRG